MLPFTMAQSSNRDALTADIASPSKGSNSSNFSLNGLFGETTGLDEQIASTFAIQPSPPAGSMLYGKRPLSSPSISPTNQMVSSQQQPVLLSDLADSNGIMNFNRKILCSFVSNYDNSRCTNLAVTIVDGGKSFCQKHLHIADGLNSGSMLAGYQPRNNHTTISQASVCTASAQFTNGFDVADKGITHTSKQSTFTHSKLPTQKPVEVVAQQIKNATSAGGKAKNNSFVNSQQFTINGEVLRTVVDMLNKNQGGLTTKQQIKLLNSLGVIVATVKNPTGPHNGNLVMHPQVSKQPFQSLPSQVMPLMSNITNQLPQSQMVQIQGVNSFGALPVLSKNAGEKSLGNQSKLKRKNSNPKSKETSAKRSKRSIAERDSTSLQHLSAMELDEKVSEALASVGGIKTTSQTKSLQTLEANETQQVNVTVDKREKKATLRNTSYSVVSIPSNPAFISNLQPIRTSCKPLTKYSQMEKEKLACELSLFPLGPFCDDSGHLVCTCKQEQYKLELSRSKRKTNSKVSMSKKCSWCKIEDSHHNVIPGRTVTKILAKGIASTKKVGNFLSQPSGPHKVDENLLHNRCHQIEALTKRLKQKLTRENRAIAMLLESAKTDHKETAKVLRELGTDHIATKRLPASVLPRTCKLQGKSCKNPALPYTNYCSHHVWHCSHQQLFKLNSDMSVVADIHPEPISVKPKKKSKLPPLSKKKKRKTRKGPGIVSSKPTQQSAPELQTKIIKPEIKDFLPTAVKSESVVSFDDSKPPVDSSSVEHLGVDEDSVLDAFSIDESGFMKDMMPDLLQEFSLFTGRNSDVLDNALLLAGAVDTDYSGQFAEDDVGDSPLLFPHSASGHTLNNSTPLTVGHDPKICSLSSNSQGPLCSTTVSGGDMLNASREMKGSIPDGSFSSAGMWPDSIVMQTEMPLSSHADVHVENELSLSQDSFSDDLRELEGVLESLQEEVTRETTTSFSSSTVALPVGTPALNANTMTVSDTYQMTSTNKILPLTSAASFPLNKTLASNSKTDQKPATGIQMIELRKQQTNAKKTSKHQSKKQRGKSQPLSGSQQLGNTPVCTTSCATNEQQGEGARSKSSTAGEGLRTKTGRKPRCTYPVPGYITAGTPASPLLTMGQTLRVQPKLLPGNILCTSGKLPSAMASGMVLIPVNAFVQSNNQSGQNQPVGLTLTMSPGQTCIPTNFGTVIPVRGSQVLAGNSGNQQQFIIVNGGNISNQVNVTLSNSNQKKVNQKSKVNTSSPHPTSVPSQTSQAQKTSLSQNLNATTSTTCSKASTLPVVASSSAVTSKQNQVVTPTSSTSQPWTKTSRCSPLVIPPALVTTDSAVETAAKSTQSAVQTTQSVKTSAKSSTVHWNQSTVTSEGAPPLPQTRMYGAVGGQTSNMLYCRRISPSFNNSQHVIVGRLGSLGHMGISRLAVNERLSQYQKQQQFADKVATSTASGSGEKKGGGAGNGDVVYNKKDFPPGFINIANSCRPTNEHKTDESSAQVKKEVSEASTPISATVSTPSLPNGVVGFSTPTGKRNSRKTEHTEKLEEPEFYSGDPFSANEAEGKKSKALPD